MTDDEVLPLEIVHREPVGGIDGEGSTHHFDAVRRRIYVVTDDEIEVTEHIGERHQKEWIDYVDERRGWQDLRYSDRGISGSIVPILVDIAGSGFESVTHRRIGGLPFCRYRRVGRQGGAVHRHRHGESRLKPWASALKRCETAR